MNIYLICIYYDYEKDTRCFSIHSAFQSREDAEKFIESRTVGDIVRIDHYFMSKGTTHKDNIFIEEIKLLSYDDAIKFK